jgi:hypothetical protein
MTLLAASLGHGGRPGLIIQAVADPKLAPLALAWLEPKRRLADGSVGYFIRLPRRDDCWAAAIATCLQVPIDEVPDARLDERVKAGEDPEEVNCSAWQQMNRWLEGRGLRMIIHRKVPAPRRRWVGVVPVSGQFNDHCLVMAHDTLLFDPTPNMSFFLSFGPSDIAWGFSFTSV